MSVPHQIFAVSNVQRRRTLLSLVKSAKSDSDKAELHTKRNTLSHRVQSWRQIQHVYMPCAGRLLSDMSSDDEMSSQASKPESFPLLLPSAVPGELHEAGCLPGLVKKVIRLRRAQAEDALHQVRRSLHIRQSLVHYKHIHVEGPSQSRNTRTAALLTHFQDRLRRHVERYWVARAALIQLDPNGEWTVIFRPLLDSDIRGPGRDDDGPMVDARRHAVSKLKQQQQIASNGRYEPSWIWRTLRHDVRDMVPSDQHITDDEVNEST